MVEATAGDVNGHIRSAVGPIEVSNVLFDFSKVEALLMMRQILLHWAGLDVVKSDPPENILWRIPKHDRGGVSCLADHFPESIQ
jgi:hypothetical protein